MESTVKFFVALAVMCLGIPSVLTRLPMNMGQFIRAVQQIEDAHPRLTALHVVRSLRRQGGYDDPFTEHFLKASNDSSDYNASMPNPELSQFIRHAVHHKVTEKGREKGMVLCGDGTTVALGPVLLGIEAGLLAGTGIPSESLGVLTLAQTLGYSFLKSPYQKLGPDGCWDNVTFPKVFTLSGRASFAPDALINGGMDGMLLGTHLSSLSSHAMRLSTVLNGYYRQDLKDTDVPPLLISAFRRDNFGNLVNISILQDQIWASLSVFWTLSGEWHRPLGMDSIIQMGLKHFSQRYIECPAIIPRCQWGARSYRGSPVQLKLPLSFMYIHHTLTPRQPCRSFQKCAAEMRAIQRFHKDDRSWDDIGYSFVMGSDGYLYEGRGWQWRGAHTRGHNSRGYGVAFIGDYNSTLPSRHSLRLVRERLANCGVGGGHLVSNFTWHGHRQLVNTPCPGEALYAEIQAWKGFRLRDISGGAVSQAELLKANQSDTVIIN
ncbi:N-acetylmuramoyl-L-alanine amidase-like [Arapaima gigas]